MNPPVNLPLAVPLTHWGVIRARGADAAKFLHGQLTQDVMLQDELDAPALPQRIRAAIERKRIECEARKAYATDLETGLPHQQQLIEQAH